jgi:hypothetical protein
VSFFIVEKDIKGGALLLLKFLIMERNDKLLVKKETRDEMSKLLNEVLIK